MYLNLLCAALIACVGSPPATTAPPAPVATAGKGAPPLKGMTVTISVLASGDTVATASWTTPPGNGGGTYQGSTVRWTLNGANASGYPKPFGPAALADTLVLAAHDQVGGAVAPGATVSYDACGIARYAEGTSTEKCAGAKTFTRPAALLPLGGMITSVPIKIPLWRYMALPFTRAGIAGKLGTRASP